LFLVGGLVASSLIVVFFGAGEAFFEYGNEVLISAAIPIIHCAILLLVVILIVGPLQLWLFWNHKKNSNESEANSSTYSIRSILICITYVVSYHMPYMILAFINNPLQTIFTHIAIVTLFTVYVLPCMMELSCIKLGN